MSDYDFKNFLNNPLAANLICFLANRNFNKRICSVNKDCINILSSENEKIQIPHNYTLWNVFMLLSEYKAQEQEVSEMLNNLIRENYFMKLFSLETFFNTEISSLPSFNLDYTSDKGKEYLKNFYKLEEVCPLPKSGNTLLL